MSTYALITGASHGIGKSIAEALAKEGYNLILTCASSIDILADYSSHLEESYHITCIAKQCDMKNIQEVQSLFQNVPAPEIVINNAGISYVGLLQDMTAEEWNDVIGTNLSSAFYTAKFAIPGMLTKHCGSIINISSVWGSTGASMEVAYSASKGGLNTFTKALAKELAPSGIQVNALACGLIDTRMNAHLSQEDINTLIDEIPAGRMGQAEEIATAVIALLQMPSYVTGQIINLDGGWT